MAGNCTVIDGRRAVGDVAPFPTSRWRASLGTCGRIYVRGSMPRSLDSAKATRPLDPRRPRLQLVLGNVRGKVAFSEVASTTGDAGRGVIARLRGRMRGVVHHQLREIGYGWGPRLRSAIRRRWLLLSHPHASIRFEGPVHIAPGCSFYIPDRGTLIVGPNVEFRRGFRIEVVGDARVVIGANCVFSYYSVIQCAGSIEIGEGCGFGQSCMIVDGNHHFRDFDKPFMHQGFELRPIRIGNECGVLTKTTVINDIGERAQIGANSVVAKPVPAYCMAVGVPARVITYFGPEGQSPPELADDRSLSPAGGA